MYRIIQKLKSLKKKLKQLHRGHYSELSKRVNQMRSQLSCAQVGLRHDYTEANRRKVEDLLVEYNDLLAAEDEFLKQLVKDNWLMLMDRNASYFYNVIKGKR